jgi:hypothetical protein
LRRRGAPPLEAREEYSAKTAFGSNDDLADLQVKIDVSGYYFQAVRGVFVDDVFLDVCAAGSCFVCLLENVLSLTV